MDGNTIKWAVVGILVMLIVVGMIYSWRSEKNTFKPWGDEDEDEK